MINEFLKRTLSTLILIPLVFFIIVKGSYFFYVFLILIFLISSYEWFNMTKKKFYNAYGYFLSFHTFNGLLRFFYRLIFRKTKKINERLDYFYPDWISGSFVIISKNKFHKIGKWDERFWMYYEDMDLCKRAKENDMEIIMLEIFFKKKF